MTDNPFRYGVLRIEAAGPDDTDKLHSIVIRFFDSKRQMYCTLEMMTHQISNEIWEAFGHVTEAMIASGIEQLGT